MDRHTIIYTADERQEKLYQLLDGRREGSLQNVFVNDDALCEKIYVLPIPVTKLNQNPIQKEKLKQELIKNEKGNACRQKVFGGTFDREWCSFFEMHRIEYYDFMRLPEIVEGNAHITAEGVVAEMLRFGRYSIAGQCVLVTGYGCCGEKIAKLLSHMGANVTVAVRRAEIRNQVLSDGLSAIDFSQLTEYMAQMKTVINTVPSLVIREEHIARMPKDAWILDIASRPGGTDFEAAEKHGVCARLSLGLPGIYTTTSSAMLLKDAISVYAPILDDVREEKSWIFQIVI